jgi:hypothetical protein
MLLALMKPVINSQTASAQEIIDSQVTYTFAGQIDFQAIIQPDLPIEEILVFIRNSGETDTIIGEASFENGQVVYTHDLTQQPLRAFSEIVYWYGIETQGGDIQNSETYTFYYEDNRFDWQLLSDPPFRVHWYAGDVSFARSVLDAAQAGLNKSIALLNLAVPDEIDIYVYASGLEMQSTLRLAGLNWVAGHADPDLNIMVVSLPPGPDQLLETERQIPHELMHILLYQTIGTGYDGLPVWFNEGLGSINELRPNPDYFIILDSAINQDNLIPISDLCESFPTDASSIYLAYAQADSFTRYLQRQFGTPGLQELLDNYAAGIGCERGTEVALDASLDQLELQWRGELSGTTEPENAGGDILPWALILLIVLGAPALLSIGHLSRSKRPSGE